MALRTTKATYLGDDSDFAALGIRRRDSRQYVILPTDPRRQRGGTVLNRNIGERCLRIPDARSPGPFEARISHAWGISSELTMERTEFPFPIASLFGFNVPNMIPFGFGFFPIFIESKDVLLFPQIVADLIRT